MDASQGPKLVVIPAGWFRMGSEAGQENERPVHRVWIDSFCLAAYPVSNAEFKKFIDATHYRPKDSLNFLKDWKDGTYPDGRVSRQGNSFSPGFRVSLKGHLVCCPISPVFDCVGAYRSRDSRFFALGKARHVPV